MKNALHRERVVLPVVSSLNYAMRHSKTANSCLSNHGSIGQGYLKSQLTRLLASPIVLLFTARKDGDQWSFSASRLGTCLFVYHCFDRIVING